MTFCHKRAPELFTGEQRASLGGGKKRQVWHPLAVSLVSDILNQGLGLLCLSFPSENWDDMVAYPPI